MSAEPGRKRAYSIDIRWQLISSNKHLNHTGVSIWPFSRIIMVACGWAWLTVAMRFILHSNIYYAYTLQWNQNCEYYNYGLRFHIRTSPYRPSGMVCALIIHNRQYCACRWRDRCSCNHKEAERVQASSAVKQYQHMTVVFEG